MFKITVLRFLPVEKNTKHGEKSRRSIKPKRPYYTDKKKLRKSFFWGGRVPTYFLLNGNITTK